MSMTVTCPDCDKTLKVKDDAAGKKVRCPACSTVLQIPAKSKDADDDFLDDLEEAAPSKKRKRRSEDDFDDDEPVASPRTRKSTKKKSGRTKSGGTNWVLIGGLTGGGLILVLFVAMLVAAIGQAKKNLPNQGAQLANWPTFKHPMGFIQADMPGTPILNVKQSQNGSQTYSLLQPKFEMSLVAIPLPDAAKAAIASNPAAIDLMFNEMEAKAPQQKPGAKVLASSRLTSRSTRGLEMKIGFQGTH